MSKTNSPKMDTLKPFLGSIFEPGIDPLIATGFKYTPAEVSVHGVKTHGGIDFDLPRGTKLLAPADGYYVATYGEFLMKNEDGSTRKLSLKQALSKNPSNKDIHPPDDTSEWSLYYGSYVIQGWHGRGRYTQFAHVDWVAPAIPYYSPVEIKDDQGKLTGDLQYSDVLRVVVSEYKKPNVASFVRAGQVIGEVGMTGCGWGKRCFDFAKLAADGRPDFRGTEYTYYTEPHLHFMTFGRRAPRSRKPKLYDPFGIYGEISAGYPPSLDQWGTRQRGAQHDPLWLSI